MSPDDPAHLYEQRRSGALQLTLRGPGRYRDWVEKGQRDDAGSSGSTGDGGQPPPDQLAGCLHGSWPVRDASRASRLRHEPWSSRAGRPVFLFRPFVPFGSGGGLVLRRLLMAAAPLMVGLMRWR